MQIELRKIDGQDFVVTRNGKKEYVRTPQEVVSIEQRNIVDAEHDLVDRRQATAAIEQRIESALLAGENCSGHRIDLAAAREEEQILLDDIAASQEITRQVFRLIDDHEANEIRTAAAARLAATLAPYDETIKELA